MWTVDDLRLATRLRAQSHRLSYLKTRSVSLSGEVLPCSLVPEIPKGYKPDTRVPFLGGNPASILRDMDSRAQLKEEGGKGP